MKLYLSFALLCFTTLSKTAYGWTFFKYDESLLAEKQALLAEYFYNLDKLPTGKKLLNYLELKFHESHVQLIITQGEYTLFNSKKNHLEISHKFLSEPSFVGCIGKNSTFLVNTEQKNGIEIGQARNPSHITLGHELIHFLHFLEDPIRYRTDQLQYTAQWGQLMKGQIHNVLWNNDEEQRTVISNPDEIMNAIKIGAPIFSETQLRLEQNHAPRYAYQEATRHFYEDPEIIDYIFHFLIETKNNNEHFRTQLIREDWSFNQEGAKDERYSFFKRPPQKK